MPVKPPLISFVLGVLVLGLSACQSSPDDSLTKEPSASERMEVDYVVVQPQPIANQISVTGTLVAAESALLSAQMAGLVQEIHFREGQRVKRGELLVQLDDRQLKARLAKLDAQLETARTDLARKRELLDIQGIPQADVDAAELLLASLQADRQELEVMIDYARIHAPFTGTVGLRNVSPGAYLSPGDPVVQLVQVDPLRLEFNVPERYAAAIRAGQEVRFQLAKQDETYAARVYATEPAISTSTRALRIRARVPNNEGKLLAGAFTEIALTLDSIPDALLVPTEALIPRLNEQILYRVRQGKIEEVTVESGIRLARQVEIRAGLSPGDTIMVSGLLQAKPGLAVAPGQEITIEIPEQSSL